MKKILALSAVAALTLGVSAYAANPFADVSMDHWAYQAVADLSAQGVVEGYPNGTFMGENHITRFEMAQIVARMMAQESQMNAEQKATVDKLAAEYADELVNLGVRVSNIEEKMGNVKFTGDARVKFERTYKKPVVGEKDYKDTFKGRMRLNLEAKANDKVSVKARIVTNLDLESGKGLKLDVKRLHAQYKPTDNFMFDIGRMGVTLGSGVWYDNSFDGISAKYENEKIDAQVGFGRFRGFRDEMYDPGSGKPKVRRTGYFISRDKNHEAHQHYHNIAIDNEMIFAQGHVKLHEKVKVGAFYTTFAKYDKAQAQDKFFGVNAKVQLMDNISVDGEYIKDSAKYEDVKPTLWHAGVNVKHGAYAFGVRYFDMDGGSYLGGTSIEGFKNVENPIIGATFYQATAKIALAKNVELKSYYNFNLKGKKQIDPTTHQDVTQPIYKTWGMSLNYMF